MTTPDYRTDAGPYGATSGATDSGGVKDQAQQAAGTASDQGRHLAGVAQGEARSVAGEASAHVQGLVQQAGQELDQQGRQQKDRLASTVRTFGDDLDGMASQADSGLASQVAREVADRARSVSSHLEQREPRELLDDVRDFARRRPGTFLLGALAAGVVAGRLARGAKDAQSGGTSGGTSTGVDGLAGGFGQETATLPATPAPTTPAPYSTGTSGLEDPLADVPAPSTVTGGGPVVTDPVQPGGRS